MLATLSTIMLSGKAAARALRGHLLVDAALHILLLADAYNVALPFADDSNKPEVEKNSKGSHDDVNCVEMQVADGAVGTDLTEAKLFYARIVASDSTVSCLSDVLKKLQSTLSDKKNSITRRTKLLWVQLLEMVDILRKFLKAERTGNWRLHLESVGEMLPFFAASGHTLYAKSAHVYLQTMLELPRSHPDLYQK